MGDDGLSHHKMTSTVRLCNRLYKLLGIAVMRAQSRVVTAMTSLTRFRQWLKFETQNLQSIGPTTNEAVNQSGEDVLSLECTETMDSVSSDGSTPSVASILKRDMLIRQLQQEMSDRYALPTRIRPMRQTAPVSPIPSLNRPSIDEPPTHARLQFFVIYTYLLNGLQYFRIVRACKSTLDKHERVMRHPYTRKYKNRMWLKLSPVRIFTHPCVNAMNLWNDFRAHYPDFVYGLRFVSFTAFTFHTEKSLRQRFVADICARKTSSNRETALRFVDVDDCVVRCLTPSYDYSVALQSHIMDFIENSTQF